MVSLRKQRLRSPSPPSDGTDPCIPELEPIKGRNMIHDFSDTRSDQSHESEENNAYQSEDQAFSVPETVCRTPLDQVEPRLMSMSSILARSRPAEPVWLHLDLNQKPGEEVLPSTELQLGLGRGQTIPALPAVKFRRAGSEDEVSEDTGEVSVESMGSEDENEENEVSEIMSDGESSDCSIETRYLKSWGQTPSVSSRRRGRVAFKRGNSILLPECRSVDGDINVARNQRMKNYTREYPLSRATRNDNDGEVSAPGSSGHYLRSTTANDDPDEGDEAPEEGSVMHSVYSLVMVCGEEGISKEDVLVSLHGQSRPAMLAHTDWEADVKLCLKSRFFVQVQGQYILRKYYCHSSSKGKEKESLSSEETGIQDRRKFKGKSVHESLSMDNNKDHGVGGRGSLRAKQKMIEENGTQEGARRCALMASVHRKTPWQCPLMAMKDHKLCEHHFERREFTKMKAKAMRKKTNSGQGEFFGGSTTV